MISTEKKQKEKKNAVEISAWPPHPLDVTVDVTFRVVPEQPRPRLPHAGQGERLVADGALPLVAEFSKGFPLARRR